MPLGDIRISSNFSISSQRPLDDRIAVTNEAERLAFTIDRRYNLMRVDEQNTNKSWQLVLGTVDNDLLNNANWIQLIRGVVYDNEVPLYQNLIATIEAGGVKVGDSFIQDNDSIRTVLNAIIAPYVQPILNSIDITPAGPVEVGTAVTIQTALITWTVDSETNNPTDAAIIGDGFGIVVFTSTPQIVAAFPGVIVTKTTNTTATWELTGKDKDAVALPSVSNTIIWRFMHTFGANASIIIDDSTANAVIAVLQNQALASGKARTVTCTVDNNNPSNYTYISYAAKFGDLTKVLQDGALDVLDAFTNIGDFNYINSQGHSELYRVYKSNAPGAFSDGVVLTIT